MCTKFDFRPDSRYRIRLAGTRDALVLARAAREVFRVLQALGYPNVTCHELVHACSAHLRLPAWLNEGIATFTAERFLGRPTIRQDTRAFTKDYRPKAAPPTYRELSRMGGEAIAYHGMRGCWLVRYLEEMQPGFLRLVRPDMPLCSTKTAGQLATTARAAAVRLRQPLHIIQSPIDQLAFTIGGLARTSPAGRPRRAA